MGASFSIVMVDKLAPIGRSYNSVRMVSGTRQPPRAHARSASLGRLSVGLPFRARLVECW